MNAQQMKDMAVSRKELLFKRKCLDYLFKARIRMFFAARKGLTSISDEVECDCSEYFMENYVNKLKSEGYRVSLRYGNSYHVLTISWGKPLLMNSTNERNLEND